MTRYASVLLVALWGGGMACTPGAPPPAPPIEEPAKPRPPGAPGAVSARAEVGGATLTWSAPTEEGRSALTGYQVDSEPREASLNATVEGTTARVTGLRAGATYRFGVSARSAAGEGPMSHSEAVTLPDVPGAPRDLAVVRGNQQVRVTWTPPGSDGGRPVLGYVVSAPAQGARVLVEATARAAVVMGLTNGVASTFTVRAFNAVGEGPDAPLSASVVPATGPSAVREVGAVAGVRALTVTWREPADSGGVPVTEYLVKAEPGGHGVRADASARGATLTGLRNGTEYTLRVVARNEAGEGTAASALSWRTLVVPPEAPGAVRAESEVGGATLSWSAPTENGGDVLTGYRVESEPREASLKVLVEGTTARVTGLRTGATYRFGVSARNGAGEGPASRSESITLPDLPGAPQGVAAARGDRQVEVTWTPPASDGGRPVLGYLVTARPQGTRVRVEATARSARVMGLTNGVASTFTVRALNAVGEGPDSPASASVVPAAVPSVVRAVGATADIREATVTWSEPADMGGVPVTEYVVTAEPGGHGVRAGASARSVTLTGLRNGTAYTLGVAARNEVGEGPAAFAPPRRTLDVPRAPGGLKTGRDVRSARVVWEAPAEDGGRPITGYSVEVRPTGRRVNVGAGVREVTVTDLPSTRAYTLAVSALNVVGTGPAALSAPVRPVPVPLRILALEVPVSPSGCVSIAYTLGQDDGERADVLVEVDARGTGTFRPATQAGSTDHEGTLARSSSPGGTAHRFLWNRAQDVRGAASVQVRVSARITGATTVSRTVAVSLPATSQRCELSLDGARVSTFPLKPYTVTPLASTAGDFDQDGKLDLIVMLSAPRGFLQLKGLGNGHFSPGPELDLGVFQNLSPPPVAADVDGDGALDLLWMDASRYLGVARGLGNGVFMPAQTYDPGAGLALAADKPGLVVADFNGDGLPDVAMNSPRGPGLFLNQGTGTLGAFQPLNVPSAMLLGADLDANGHQDLLLLRPGESDTVLLSNGDGTFRSHSAGLPSEPLLGDFNTDGRVDLLFLSTLDASSRTLLLRLGDGLGGFGAETSVATIPGSAPPRWMDGGSFTVGELDGDGLLDLALVGNADRQSHPVLLLKGRGGGSFAPPVELPVPRIASFLSHADFNGDGVSDLLAIQIDSQWADPGAPWDRRDVRVWLGGPERMARSAPQGPVGPVATGDLNADGWEDVLFAAQEERPPVLRVRFGSPTGLSASQVVFTLPRSVAAIDIVRADADALPDVVLHGIQETHSLLLLGNADGTLRRAADLPLDSTIHVESGDVNQDGKPDLVATELNRSRSTREARLRLGRGDGTFEAPLFLADVGGEGSPTLVDLDRDGSLDVVMLMTGGGPAARVLLGRGDGSFVPGPVSSLEPAGGGHHLSVADMDGDGIADLVYCREMSALQIELRVLKGTGTGAFTPLGTTPSTAACTKLLVVDLDGDGWRDVLAGGWNSDSVSVWRGQGQGLLSAEQGFGTYLYDPGGVFTLAVLDANGDGQRDVIAGRGLRVNTLLLQR